jgi:putative hemolysin
MFLFFLGLFLFLLVSLSEQALVRLSAHDLEAMRGEEEPVARRAVRMAEELRSSLAALLLARVFLALMLGVGGIQLLLGNSDFKMALYQFSEARQVPGWLVWGGLAAFITLFIAFLLWGLQKVDILKSKSGRITFLLKRLGLFMAFWKIFFGLFIYKEKKAELESAFPGMPNEPDSTPAGASEKREMELLKSIVQFGDVTVKQVMQPRSKVVAVDFKTSFPELLKTVRKNEFSRMPIIDDDLDNVVGILYVKDLVSHLNKPAAFEWQTLIRTNHLLIPESKRCSELLREFKLEKMHMAIVVDEYGGSAGIVTLEDILEEVIGEIRDEFDEDSDVRYRKIDAYTYLFEGQALLNDVCRITGLPVNSFDAVRGNSDTLAGLVLELRGDIPPVGAEVSWDKFLLTVVAADSRRIEQVRLGLGRG